MQIPLGKLLVGHDYTRIPFLRLNVSHCVHQQIDNKLRNSYYRRLEISSVWSEGWKQNELLSLYLKFF